MMDFNSKRFPTIAEIQQKAQKPNWRTQGNWLARYWARPSAVFGTWISVRVGLSPNCITALAAISWMTEGILIASGQTDLFLAGVAFGLLGFWLDHVDGQVARYTNSASLEGIYFDFWMHTAHFIIRGFCIGWGLFQFTGEPLFAISGFLTGWGWLMLSQENDARYKAIFACLAKSDQQFVTHKPTAESPETAESRTLRHNVKYVITGITRLQEPHNTLCMELLIGVLLKLHFISGIWAWKLILMFWATSAPVLAVARLVRTIRRSRVSADFANLFLKTDEMNEQ